ncbi:MAG: hypothetical protein RBU21_00350 [FCB group bacterium]|jgi:hypothetical protein|nr:hypothetical protein [FCB group bacterium]
MKRFTVSLDIVASKGVTGSELARSFGLAASAFTCRRTEEKNYWRYEPTADEGMTLVDRITLIASALHPEDPPIRFGTSIIDVGLIVGVFYDTANCSICFPARLLDSLILKIPEVDVEIVCYPVCEQDE